MTFTFLLYGNAIANRAEDIAPADLASDTLPDLEDIKPAEGYEPPKKSEPSSAKNKSELILLLKGEVTMVDAGEAAIQFRSAYSPNVDDKVYFSEGFAENAEIITGAGVIIEVAGNEIWASITRGSPKAGMTATITSINPVKNKVETTGKPHTPATSSIAQDRPDSAQSAESLYQTGRSYYMGEGVAQNYDKAFQFLSLAAGENHAAAQNDVGMMYEHGQGTDKNLEEAFNWYKKSSDQNYPAAHYNLGRLYDSGIGAKKNYSSAIISFRRAAQLGDKKAQARLEKQRLSW